MSGPSFSICIPNYNYGRFIGDTIRSVLDQSYQDFEIIVADNASTDDSLEVVRSFKDDRIRLVQNRYNIGFAPNLQVATMHAQGDILNLLSSDDQMKPGALAEYAAVAAAHPEAEGRLVLFSDAEGFDNDGHVTRQIRKAADSFARVDLEPGAAPPAEVRHTTHRGLDVLRDSLLRLDAPAVFCATAYSRRLWEEVEGYNAARTFGPDKHFAYKLLSRDPLVAYVHAPLFRYRDFLSDNRAAAVTTMRQPVDDYLNVLEFSNEAVLKGTGLTRADLERAFTDRVLRAGLVHLGRGRPAAAFRHLAFAMSSFPRRALGNKRTYALLPLLATGPAMRFAGPPLRRAAVRVRGRRR